MTPKQRFQSALELKAADRIPIFYQHLGASSHLLKSFSFTTKDAFYDPEKFARLSMESYRQFKYDNVMAGWGDLLTEAQAHGLKWKFTDPRFYPRPDVYLPLSKADEIQPVDPLKDPLWSVPLRAASIMVHEIGKEVAVLGSCCSPTWIVSETIGFETMLMAYFQQPEQVHNILQKVVESCKAYGERVHQVGLEEVFVDDSGAGKEMVSLDMYERFDASYLREVMSHWRGQGLRTILHNDSAMPYVEAQADLKPSALHIHLTAVEPSTLFSLLKGRVCVMAGIDHTVLLFKKSPEEVEAEVERTIKLWGDDTGFVIAPGCELPYKTPLENIVRLKQATIKFGTTSS